MMTTNQILLSIVAFIGAIGVKQLIKMAKDIGEIKIFCGKIDTKHDALENRVDKLEERIFPLDKNSR